MAETFTSFGDLGQRVGIYSVAKLLSNQEPRVCIQKFGKSEPVPKNKGETIKWRRPKPLAVDIANITEGVTPAPDQFQYEDVTATLLQFGSHIQFSDKVLDLHEDNVMDDAMRELAKKAASQQELYDWTILRGGTSVLYANGSARSDVNTPVDADLIYEAIETLEANHANFIEEMVKPGPNYATEATPPAFVALGHTNLRRDIENLDGFIPVEKYGSSNRQVSEYEVGSCRHVRFILTPHFIPFAGAGSGTANGMKVTGSNVDVYPIVILAQEAFGTCVLKGMESVKLEAYKPRMTDTDPMGQRGSVAMKYWRVTKILNDSWMVRLEVGSTDL